jgi:hypothetical protein
MNMWTTNVSLIGCFVWNNQVVMASNSSVFFYSNYSVIATSPSAMTISDIVFSGGNLYASMTQGTLVFYSIFFINFCTGGIYELVNGAFQVLAGISVQNLEDFTVLDTDESIAGDDAIFIVSSIEPSIRKFIKTPNNDWVLNDTYSHTPSTDFPFTQGICSASGTYDDLSEAWHLFVLPCNGTSGYTAIYDIEYSYGNWSFSMADFSLDSVDATSGAPVGVSYYRDVVVMPPFQVLPYY